MNGKLPSCDQVTPFHVHSGVAMLQVLKGGPVSVCFSVRRVSTSGANGGEEAIVGRITTWRSTNRYPYPNNLPILASTLKLLL